MTWKTVCFDFDGTLADTLPLTFHCLKAVFEKYDSRTYSNQELLNMFGPTEDGIIKNHLKNKDKFDLAVEMYYRLYEQDHDSFVHHNEDIERMLHYLKYKGLKLGVMTGKSRRAFAISSTLCGLSHFFDVVITGDEVQHPKPHPEGLLKVMKELGSTPQEMIFIGDSLADIQSGKRANVTTAGVHWLDTYQSDHFETKPDYIWTHVDEFVSFFQKQDGVNPELWLDWSKKIQAISQIGLTYGKDIYDLERYEQLRQLSIQIMETYSGVSRDKIALTFASDTGYATPKVDIRAVILNEEKEILLVQEKSDGRWALPGGWADIGYSPSEIAVKETKEESGLTVSPIRLLAVMDKMKHHHPPEPYHIYKLIIQCKIIGGKMTSGVETNEVRFFSINALPNLSLERNTIQQLLDIYQLAIQSDHTVIFD